MHVPIAITTLHDCGIHYKGFIPLESLNTWYLGMTCNAASCCCQGAELTAVCRPWGCLGQLSSFCASCVWLHKVSVFNCTQLSFHDCGNSYYIMYRAKCMADELPRLKASHVSHMNSVWVPGHAIPASTAKKDCSSELVRLKKGDPLSLECGSDCTVNHNFRWWKAVEGTSASHRNLVEGESGASLYRNAASLMDGGTYTCQCTNGPECQYNVTSKFPKHVSRHGGCSQHIFVCVQLPRQCDGCN